MKRGNLLKWIGEVLDAYDLQEATYFKTVDIMNNGNDILLLFELKHKCYIRYLLVCLTGCLSSSTVGDAELVVD